MEKVRILTGQILLVFNVCIGVYVKEEVNFIFSYA